LAELEAPRSALQHQFEDMEQQFEASTLGMWIFLATEVMFFGGLFAGYVVYRTKYPAAWVEASHQLDILLGAVNTAVLIGSSLTMAMGVWAAQQGKRRMLIWFLVLTILLGSAFLGIKAVEYTGKFHQGLVPGKFFSFEAVAPTANVELFFSFYFVMTGMHALHMVIGIAMLAVFVWMAARGRFTKEYFTPVEVGGLYWHFVDIVWIFLFPLLYLIGRH
jgi:cytochrome c oxidase subunit III